jgi:dTDP-4-amino-4,6-dideoxygalactose transaminase
MAPRPFKGVFTQQEPIGQESIAAAVRVLETGRLHRYNTIAGETSETSLLEQEFAAWQGSQYCLACASGGYAMHISLVAAGLLHGEPVLTNAFTLSPVPGAIVNAGGAPVLVDCTRDLVIDIDDFERKAVSSGSRFLLLSHMRGHIADMDRLMAIAQARGIMVIEDCAHTMGATWNGVKSGNFGLAGCFSTQTYKHMNSGEGGLLVSNDPHFMARAIILSGSYMLYERHGAAPDVSFFEDIRFQMPNCSGRMDNLRAAILRPQIATLQTNIDRWNERHDAIANALRASGLFHVPVRPAAERPVGSSIQFLVEGISDADARRLVADAKSLGVELKWFGDANPVGFTSNHHSWRYFADQELPRTDRVLSALFDMRIPLTFSLADCEQIAGIIVHCAGALRLKGAA